MVGRLRNALRAYALEGHEPAKVVDQLNRLVWTESRGQPDGDPAVPGGRSDAERRPLGERRASTTAAGRRGRAPQFLEGGASVPLGVLPFPVYEERSTELRPGGTVVLYTDGLVERPGAHIDDGMARLASVVGEAPPDPERLCDHLLAHLVPAGGTADDVALARASQRPDDGSLRGRAAGGTRDAVIDARAPAPLARHLGASDQEIHEITTACGEAATNAIEHAGSAGGVPFELGGRSEGPEVQITVRDFGAWRDPREGDQGRGLSLIRALMDTVDVAPRPEGTTVRLRWAPSKAGGHGGPE